MSLKPTNLVIQTSQLPATFKGTPNDLLAAMVQRMLILSPSGTNFLFIGDAEPTSNVGPWLKGGTKWYVWDESTKRYVPLDVSDSIIVPFKIGASTPTDSTPPVWLKTTQDATDISPLFGEPVGWYIFNGSVWVPFIGIVLAGPSASRPTAPVEYQQFYDTDITCLIWWERGQWRTVAGVPGDVKAVSFSKLTDALAHNPGWDVLGASSVPMRGRVVMQATKDAGPTPETVLPVASGVIARGAFDTFGETQGITPDVSTALTMPPSLALWHLVKL